MQEQAGLDYERGVDRLLTVVDQTRGKILFYYMVIIYGIFGGSSLTIIDWIPFGAIDKINDPSKANALVLATGGLIGFYLCGRHMAAARQLRAITPNLYRNKTAANLLDFIVPLWLARILFLPSAIMTVLFLTFLGYGIVRVVFGTDT